METIKIQVAGNITYSDLTYNTPLFVEYKHTGKQWRWEKRKKQYLTTNEEIAKERIAQGIKVRETSGYYFIERIAIPTTHADGKKGTWYITNEGDNYSVNKTSKYWKKVHADLSKEEVIKTYNVKPIHS